MREPLALAAALSVLACTNPSPTSGALPSSRPSSSCSASARAAPVASVPPASPESLVREDKEILVRGTKERWRLEWQTPPAPHCRDQYWSTCPCFNLAFGEIGDLAVVRLREGKPEQRVTLRNRPLQRWPVYEADHERFYLMDEPTLRRRPTVPLLEFADYDHDGKATEFVLESGASPCSSYETIVVGASRRQDEPHVFTVRGRADTPVALNGKRQWEEVRGASPDTLARGLELVQSRCGNHGSGTELTFVLRLVDGEFDLTFREYDCQGDSSPVRAGLLKSGPWPRPEKP